MKKNLFVVLALLSVFSISHAQTTLITKTQPSENMVTGTVKDTRGNFLHFAFVQDKQTKSRTYTDSVGNFFILTTPNSALFINCAGFKDTVVRVNGQSVVSVVLTPSATVANGNVTADASTSNTALLQRNLSDQMNLNSPKLNTIIQQGSIMSAIHIKDETQGSPYLFKTWVHGYVINSVDSLIQSSSFLLNYDKIDGYLSLTQDNKSVIKVDKDRVKSFTLFDTFNQPATFTMVPDIDKVHYVQVIADGKNYKIYKLIKTKFVAANYVSDGVSSTGNNFDSYEDEYTYYILDVKTNQLQKVNLKKKAIKQAFAADGNKVDEYFQTNSGDIDDNYLQGLGDYMNK